MRKIVIVNSSLDPAGTNIFQTLVENFGFDKTDEVFDSSPIYGFQDILLVTTRKEIVKVGSELDRRFGLEDSYYVFISRHRAESKIPSLTAHFTGNFGSAVFGGNPREISKYAPSILKQYMLELQSLREQIPAKYNLTLEATHHGPTDLRRPLMFVELGSSEDQWNDKNAALIIAKALMNCLLKTEKRYPKCAFGLGGTHYPEKFNKLEFADPDVALGVIVPKYSLEHLDEGMLKQVIDKSEEKISLAALDMKGLGKEKNRIIQIVNSLGLEILTP